MGFNFAQMVIDAYGPGGTHSMGTPLPAPSPSQNPPPGGTPPGGGNPGAPHWEDSPQDRPDEDRDRNRFWRMVKLSYAGILAVLGFIALAALILGIKYGYAIAYGGLSVFVMGLTITAGYTIGSIRKLGPDERGSKYFLDRYIHSVEPGPTLVPIGFCSIRRVTMRYVVIRISKPDPKRDDLNNVIEEVHPDYPKDSVIRHFDEPLRVTFAEFNTASWEGLTDEERGRFRADDPLNQRLTTDPYMVLIGRVRDHRRFLETMGTIDEAAFNLDRVARTALQQFCANRTAAYTLQFAAKAQETIFHTLEQLVADPHPKDRAIHDRLHSNRPEDRQFQREWFDRTWGFDLTEVRLEALGLPNRVNKAIADARKAQYDRETIVTAADAEKQKRTKEGEGAAIARQKMGVAEADARKKMGLAEARAKEKLLAAEADGLEKKRGVIVKDGGNMIAQLETARAIAENADYMIAPPGDLLGATEAVKRVWNRPRSGQQPQPPQT